jgi:hypothetical protein
MKKKAKINEIETKKQKQKQNHTKNQQNKKLVL